MIKRDATNFARQFRVLVVALGCLLVSYNSVFHNSCNSVTAFIVTTRSVGEKINGNINVNVDPIVLQATAGASELELASEPKDGEEITSVKTMAGSRMKNLGEATGLTGVRDENDSDGTIYKMWLQATVDGALVKEIHTTVLKDSARKANFPGFRKGQVPPYAMPQIRGFSVEESIVKTCQSAVDAYGLKSVSGSDGEVEILENVPELAKVYKLGDDIQFTATFNAMYDPAVQRQEEKEPKKEDNDDSEASDDDLDDDNDKDEDAPEVEYESYVDGKRIA